MSFQMIHRHMPGAARLGKYHLDHVEGHGEEGPGAVHLLQQLQLPILYYCLRQPPFVYFLVFRVED